MWRWNLLKRETKPQERVRHDCPGWPLCSTTGPSKRVGATWRRLDWGRLPCRCTELSGRKAGGDRGPRPRPGR